MDRNLWRKSYGSFPKLPCPKCATGFLKQDQESLQRRETGYSKREHQEAGWDPEWVTERFVCFLVCQGPWCGEVVTVSGYVNHGTQEGFDHETEEPISFDTTDYVPNSMRPAPPVFPVSRRLDKKCKVDLVKAFELLWADPAACANRIRVFVEHLMDALSVPREGKRADGTKYTADLHDRIEMLSLEMQGHKKTLHALRKVGNFASHSGGAKFETAVDCFFLLEVIVDELVNGRQEFIDKIAERLSVKGADL